MNAKTAPSATLSLNSAAAAAPAVTVADVAAVVQPAAVTPSKWPERARLVTAQGRMLHLHTGHWFSQEPGKKVEIDDFIRAQLDAGKLLISED